jgi:hypothetical protein
MTWAYFNRTNQWRLSGELPGCKHSGERLAKSVAAQKRQNAITSKAGLNSTAKQDAYRTRADKNLRKFSWEQTGD